MIEYTLPELETKRLLIRPMELADAADLMAVYGDQDVMLAGSLDDTVQSLDDLYNYIQEYDLNWQRRRVPPTMVLELLDTGKVIGIIHYYHLFQRNAEMGYLLARSYWNQGYMTEAVQGMIQLGFTVWGFHRIEVQYDPENIASGRLLHSLGFVQEGRLRSVCRMNDGQYHDFVVCALLEEDYHRRKTT